MHPVVGLAILTIRALAHVGKLGISGLIQTGRGCLATGELLRLKTAQNGEIVTADTTGPVAPVLGEFPPFGSSVNCMRLERRTDIPKSAKRSPLMKPIRLFSVCLPAPRISVAAVLLMSLAGRAAFCADGAYRVAPAAWAARPAIVELQEPAAPAQDSSPVRSVIPVRDDAALVALAAARPQPKDQAAVRLGPDQAVLQSSGMTRPWGMSASAWEAAAFCHRPLYFEDENLERHGRSFGLVQPAVSAVHFAGRAVAWPYLAGAFPPHECIYTLGRERPGSCAPYQLYRPPVSVHGAVYEAAAITGLSFVVP